MNPEERRQLIAKYKDGYDEVMRALDRFPKDALTAHPIPGKWSACEIAHHLADSETVSGIRLKKLLVEDHPLIQSYDQDAFAVRLKYNARDIGPALDAFRSTRANTAQLLDSMSEEDWQRGGMHSESGSYTADDWLGIYAEHAHNHAAQIRRLKESLAKD